MFRKEFIALLYREVRFCFLMFPFMMRLKWESNCSFLFFLTAGFVDHVKRDEFKTMMTDVQENNCNKEIRQKRCKNVMTRPRKHLMSHWFVCKSVDNEKLSKPKIGDLID